MQQRYKDCDISGKFASCPDLTSGRIVSPSYIDAMKGSCKVFPRMEILAAQLCWPYTVWTAGAAAKILRVKIKSVLYFECRCCTGFTEAYLSVGSVVLLKKCAHKIYIFLRETKIKLSRKLSYWAVESFYMIWNVNVSIWSQLFHQLFWSYLFLFYIFSPVASQASVFSKCKHVL